MGWKRPYELIRNRIRTAASAPQKRARKSRVSRFEQLEARRVLAAAIWNNVGHPTNVDGDVAGVVSPIDALLVINEINSRGSSDPITGALPRQISGAQSGHFYDVNCDNFVSPIDALEVINYLNSDNQVGGTNGTGVYPNVSCSPLLLESGEFSEEFAHELTLPDDTSAVKVHFRAPEFDTSSRDQIRDAFEIELTDQDGNQVSFPYMPGRDASYNWSEMLGVVFADGVSTTTEFGDQDSTATINLAGMEAGSRIRVTMRLVNNDGDEGSSVIIRGFEVVDSQTPAPSGTAGASGRFVEHTQIGFDGLEDISGFIGASYGRTSLAGENNELMTDLVVTNRGNQAVTGEIIVAVDNVSDLDVAAMHPDGLLLDGRPYWNLTPEMDGNPLGPGESIRSREISFRNDSGDKFTYKLKAYGRLNLAPTGFSTTPLSSIEAGRTYRYPAEATDPDGQELVYSVVAGPESFQVDSASGEVSWETEAGDVGRHRVVIRATDPHGLYVEQKFSIDVVETQQNRPPIFVSEPVTEAIASSGFEVTTVGVGNSPAGAAVISGFRGPRLVTANAGDQTIGVYAGENNDRFDSVTEFSTGHPRRNGNWLDSGTTVDFGALEAELVTDAYDISTYDHGDFNGDGYLDLVVGHHFDRANDGSNGTYKISVVLNDGNGTFGEPVDLYENEIYSYQTYVRTILVEDVNADGYADVLFAEYHNGGTLFVSLGNGDGSFHPITETSYEDTVIADFKIADIDGDGVLDLFGRTTEPFSLGRADRSLFWSRGLGDGTFEAPNEFRQTRISGQRETAAPYELSDLDGDGDLDFVVSGDYPLIQVFHNDGAGEFTLVNELTPPNAYAYYNPDWLVVGDFTGDGHEDILFFHVWQGYLHLMVGDESGVDFTYEEGTEVRLRADNWALGFEPEDVDHDGDLDIVFGSETGRQGVSVGLNDGSGRFVIREYAIPEVSTGLKLTYTDATVRGALFGDYNSDGVIDVSYFTTDSNLSGQTDEQSVGILFGTQPGEFGRTRTEPWLTTSWNDVAHPGDFNGDGILDIFDTASDVTALGNGDGSFGELVPASGVRRPGWVAAIADFDNDGLDDVVSNRSGGLYVGLSNGDGTFAVNQEINGGGFYGYNTIDPIDLNLDGFMDFVVKVEVGRYFEAHLNDPLNPGTFTMSFSYSLGEGAQGVNVSNWEESWDVGDFTGDGIPDLLTADREGYSGPQVRVVVLAGDGEGGFTPHSELAAFQEERMGGIYGLAVEPGDFATGDIDNDGDLDLLAHSYLGARVLLNDGTGHFTITGTWLDAVRTNQRGRESWLVDFNQDGNLDFVVAVAADINGSFLFWQGDGAGNFELVEGVNMHAEPLSIREPFVDWDNDGHLDLVYNTGGTTSDEIAFYLGRRDDLVDMLTVDLNGDGNEDVIAVQEQMERLQIFVGDNLGRLTRQKDLQAGLAPQAVAATDLDGDGRMELLVANRVGRDVTVYSGDLKQGYSQQGMAVGDASSLATRPIDIAAAEVNGDEHPDVLVLDAGNQALWIFPGNGTSTLSTPTAIALGDQPGRFVLEDANGDGGLDAVVTLPDSNRLMILSSIGNEFAGAPVYVELNDSPSDIAVLDLNDDGHPDLASTIAGSHVLSVHYGLGSNQFARAQEVMVGEKPNRVAVADADEDGRLDLVVSNSGDDTVSVVYNRFDPNEVYRYDSDAIDPDDDTLTYSIVDGPGGLIINGQSGQLLWAASPDQVGIHDVTLFADDGRGGVATQSFKIEVEPARENASPLIASNASNRIGANESFTYSVEAFDNDQHPLRYTLLEGPEGTTLDPTTGELNWDGRKQSEAYGLRGAAGYILVPYAESLKPESITMEGWFQIRDVSTWPYRSEIFREQGIRSYVLGDQTFQTDISLEGETIRLYHDGKAEVGQWLHVAVTYDAATGTGSLFIDGNQVDSASFSSPRPLDTTPGTTNVGVGYPTFASIDSYRVWNSARSESEIAEGLAQQYENEVGLILDYRFEDIANYRSVRDHSIYGNTGYRVSNGGETQVRPGLTAPGNYSFSVLVEDGRGGSDTQSFTLNVMPELRGSINGHLFDDLDGNGVQDDGSEDGVAAEPNLAGWHLWIDSNSNAYPDAHEVQTTTDADGNYTFSGLLPGDYPVKVSPVAGYETPSEFIATVEPEIVRDLDDANVRDYDLAIEQLSLSHIRGQLQTGGGDAIAYWKAFADLDGDGQRDDNEPAAMSDRNGDYALTGLAAGKYTIRTELPAGWIDSAGRDGLEVNLAADAISAGNDFVLEPTNTSVTGGVHFVTTPTTEVEARLTYTYASVALGISDAAIRYDLSLAPEGMVVDAFTGLVAWKPSVDDVGEHLVILRATDAAGSISLHDFMLSVTAPNTLPVIHDPTAEMARGFVGTAYSYPVIAQDAESTEVTYWLAKAPSGATIDSATGLINWEPSVADVGTHEFTAVVTDEFGGFTTATWTVRVEDSSPTVLPLTLNYPRVTASVARDYFSRITAADAIGRPVTWLMTSGPSGLTVASDGTMTWSPSADQLGVHQIVLAALTADGASESVPVEIEVTGRELNSAPTFDSEPNASVSLGQVFQYQPEIVDSDSDIHAFTLLDGPVGMSIHPLVGSVYWMPAEDQLGEHDVLIQVSDPQGGIAEQSFALTVSRFGGPPRIVSIPPTNASVGTAFLYSVDAVDREGDPLTFSLLAAPAGMMIVETTGELSWTPSADQVGEQDVVIQVSDGIGGTATLAFVISVQAGAINLPPVIESSAPRFGAVGSPYSYTLLASDPENTAITYSLGRGPVGMTVDGTTGQVTWIPAAGDEGKVVVTLIATDEDGASAVESFELDVLAQNTRPVFNSLPPTESTAGALFMYDVMASDADLDALTFELTEAPSGAEIDAFGRLRWQTELGDEGEYDFTIAVADPRGGTATQSFTLELVADTEGPRVSLIESPNDASRNVQPWQGPFVVYAKAIDNVKVASLTLTANGQDIQLDAAGTATFEFEDWFFNTIRATATAVDTSGNVTTKTISFNYDVPEGWSTNPGPEVPTAIITSPADNGTAVGMVSITGTANHEDFGAYTLSYRRADDTSFTEILRSTNPVVDGELGVWDTSLLRNDEYVIRLQVATTEGAANVVEHSVGLAGELKLGNFQLSFTDMVIPVAGIPIEITRIYDTLDANVEGDFGYGWRLDYRNTDLRVGLPSSGLEDIGIYSALRPGVKVFLNVPGEGRQGFTFDPDIRVLPGWGGQNLVLARPRFTPDPGVTSTLGTGTSSYLQVNERGELYAPGGIPYNPASPDFGGAYVLTTRAGMSYRIDGASGQLVSLRDRMGDQLLFSESGISKEGKEIVSFRRDSNNRITAIIDPSQNAISYAYSAGGDLRSVTDRNGNTVDLAYSPQRAHYLDEIFDPTNQPVLRLEYDEDGRLLREVDANGNSVSFSFDPNNRLVVTTDPLGNPNAIELNNRGLVVSETDALGNTVRREYDQVGNQTRIIDQVGAETISTFDSLGNEIARWDALNNKTTFTYNQFGDRTSTVTPLGISKTDSYNQNGALVESQNAVGGRTLYEIDGAGLTTAVTAVGSTRIEFGYTDGIPTEIRDALGGSTIIELNENQLPLSFTDIQNARDIEIQYDSNGNVMAVQEFGARSTRFQYDEFNNLVSREDSLGNQTSFEYNSFNLVSKKIYPDGLFDRYEYDPLRRVTLTQDREGNIHRFRYDAGGRLVEIIEPDLTPANDLDNPRITYEHDSAGRVTQEINQLGHAVSYNYDLVGNLIGITDARGGIITNEFDADGRQVAVTDQLGRRTTQRLDGLGNAVEIQLADGNRVLREFDQAGRLTRAIDPTGSETTYVYGNYSQLKEVRTSHGSTRYEYNDAGELANVEDPNGNVTSYDYDAFGNVTRKTRPDGGTVEYEYDVIGNLISETRHDGSVVTYVYDSLGQLTERAFGNQLIETYAYTDNGLVSSVRVGSEETSFTYDSLGRQTSRTDPNGQNIATVYDLAGNKVETISIAGSTQYSYDQANNLISIIADGQQTLFQYNAAAEQTRATYPNGTVEEISYDVMGRMRDKQILSPDSEVLEHLEFSYDAAGRVVSQSRFDGTKSEYQYDQSGRLISERALNGEIVVREDRFQYDAFGNRVSLKDITGGQQRSTYNELSQLVQTIADDAVVSFEYDANGNLIVEQSTSGDRSDFVWDAAGRLESVTKTTDGSTTVVSYTYSPDGEILSRSENGQTTSFVRDTAREHSQQIAELNSQGDILVAYDLPAIENAPIAKRTADGVEMLHSDYRQSTILVTSASGQEMQRINYTAFGETAAEGSQDTVGLLYNGEHRDPALGFDYLRRRVYDSSNGRFLSADPFPGVATDPITINSYVYAASDPVNGSDPSGLLTLKELVVVNGIIGSLGGIYVGATIGEAAGNQLAGAVVGGVLGFLGGAALGFAAIEFAAVGAGIEGAAKAILVAEATAASEIALVNVLVPLAVADAVSAVSLSFATYGLLIFGEAAGFLGTVSEIEERLEDSGGNIPLSTLTPEVVVDLQKGK
ncbi:MAG: FG-GAP-like repeat-containing protein [Aureliella sp.]